MKPGYTTAQRLVAEGLGTALLLATVVGSGIMGEQLADGKIAIALLANSLATGAVLIALILTFVSVSGAHFNPVVSMSEVILGRMSTGEGVSHAVVQVMSAFIGVALANIMFGEPLFAWSGHVRSGGALLISEAVATFGLVTVVLHTAQHRPAAVPVAVGAYITAAYWFTSSTSFANPAVTVARMTTDTFAGIRPADAPLFVVVQVVAGVVATLMYRWFEPRCLPLR